jgi:Trk-type K+ transport system membrane component
MNIYCEAADLPAIKLRTARQALEFSRRKYFSQRIGSRNYQTYIWPAMLYLLSFFCSSLALLLSGKPISALFNFILYILSIVC